MHPDEPIDELTATLRREQAVRWLLPLFFVSGATALVYQTLWNRELHLVFGTSTFAIATVLSAFMAGLAVGGGVMSRYADQTARPLRFYGLLEVFIGLYALLLPSLVTLITPIYLATWQALQPPPLLFGLIQFALIGVLLLLPTAAMGATLPLLARFATARLGAAGDRIGTLYAVNTAGAVLGTGFAGFVLLPGLGRWQTTLLAASANLLLGLGAVVLDRWASTGEAPRVDADRDVPVGSPLLLPVALCLGVGGFASLIYEVAWTRVLALMVGASVYGFSLMLLAFLIGIAIGGRVGGVWADRVLEKHGLHGVLVALAGVEVGIAALSYLLMYVFPELPFWYVWIFDLTGAASNPTAMWVTSLVVAGVVMTPPAVLMGVAFPMAVRAVVGADGKLGGPVGVVYAANTIGGVFGAFIAGFVLLPGPGVQWTIYVAATSNLVAAGIVGFAATRIPRAKWIGPVSIALITLAFLGARPPWDAMLMTSGMYHYVTDFEDHSRAGILRYAVELYEPLFYEEGLSSVVTVARNPESGNLWLANNGKVDASTTSDMPTQVLCSLLPMQFARSKDDVLVIGLASGITAGALTTLPDLKRLEIVELEPAIQRAAVLFGPWNNHVLDDPRVELLGNDGRNHLLIAEPQAYDVIVSEPSNPWITGVSNLFTREFWEMGKTRLKPGGIWSQWVQMYGMDDRDLRTLLATFAEVYPHILVYSTIADSDLVLIGSDEPLDPGVVSAQRLFGPPTVRAELERVDVRDPMDIVAMFQMDRASIRNATRGAPLNTDDNMRIEYRAPLNLHRDTHDENMRVLSEASALPEEAMRDHRDWVELAHAYERRDDVPRALLAYAKAIETSSGETQAMYKAEARDALTRVRETLEAP